MEKKLLSLLFIFSVFFLNPVDGFGQACPTSVSVSSSEGNTICENTSVTFSANVNGGTGTLSYHWKIDGVDVGSDSNQFTFSILENGDKVTVTVKSSDDTSCGTTSSDYTMTVNSNKTPTVSVSMDKTSVCPGETVTFTASNTNGGTSPQYAFYLNNSTSALQTGSSNKYSTTTINNGDYIRVILTSSLECVTSKTAEATSGSITVRSGTPNQPGIINTSIGTEICPGISQTYSISPVTDATSYQWTLPSGWSGSSSSTSIDATAGTSGGTISVKAINDCGTSEAQTIDITVKAGTPAVPGTISGETAVCPGVQETYSITAVANASEYVWTLPNGQEQVTQDPAIRVTTNTSGNSDISVKARNECGTSTAKTLSVSVKPGTPSQPGVISGTTAVCPGTQETYSVQTVTGASSYEWTLPNSGWSGTSTTNSITVTTGTTGGNFTVKAINDCGTSSEQTLSVSVKAGTPVSPGAISGSNTVCPDTSETYSISPVTGATSYIWTLPSGWSGTSTTEAITLTTAASGSGKITVKATNDCGTGTESSIEVSVSDPAPVMSGTISGPTEVCSTATGLVYSIPAITHATSYNWSLPDGWSITAGKNSNSITVTVTSNSGNISVIAINSCGESAPSAALAVNSTTGTPEKPGNISSNLTSTAICPPAESIKFWIDKVGNATGYNWILPTGWEITEGANTESITVRITANAKYSASESVSVEAVNVCGKSEKNTLTGIAIDTYVIADLGKDQVLCSSTSVLNLSGYISFGSNNAKLKITSITSSGTNSVIEIPTGKVNDFNFKYQPSQTDLSNGFVTFKLTTEKPSGSCAEGTDEMTVNFKPLPTATITAVSPVCSGNTSTLTFTGTPNSRVTFKLPNGTSQTIDIGTSGTATYTTAALSSNSTYSLVSSVNLDTPACTNSLTGSATVDVTPKPTATISYTESPFCSSDTTEKTVTLDGTNAYTGGTFNSTTGLTINSTSGAITPSSSTPGTYTVTYATPAGGGCDPVTATTVVTITKEPTASISYSGVPFCTSDSAEKPVTLNGTDAYTGGVFSAPADLTINSSTGAITPGSSKAGTYTVTYTTPAAGGCSPVPATTEVTITELPTAVISYEGAPFCSSDNSGKNVTLTGTGSYIGGTFTAPSGLSIDGSSGAIIPNSSTPGTYEITYTTLASDGCGEVTATTEISITETPFVEISYGGPFCTSNDGEYSVDFTNGIGAYEGGTFSSAPGVLDINTTTGVIKPKTSDPGTYKVTYTIPATLGCDAVVVETEVTITQLPQVSISYDAPLCNSDSNIYEVTYSSTAGDYTGGSFTGTEGLVIDSEGRITPETSSSGLHTITYSKETADDGCSVLEATTQVEIFEKVQITTQPINYGTCSSNPASFEVVATGDNLIYQWYKKDAGGTFVQINGETNSSLSFTNATSANAGEYHVLVSSSNAVCAAETSDTVTLNIDEEIIITKPAEDLIICEDDYETLSFEYEAHANGAELYFQWIKDGNPINELNDKYVMTKSGPSGTDGVYIGTLTILNIDLSDDGIYAVEIDGPDYFTCSEATSKTFTFRVNKRPGKPETAAVDYCFNDTASALTATKASDDNELLWYSYDASTDEYTYLSTSVTPTTDAPGQTSYWVSQKQPNGCESDKAELIVTVFDKPEPIATETIQFSYCFNETVTDPISITPTEGSTINWYDAVDATTALNSAQIPNTSVAKLTSYWVSQTLTSTGCESDRTKVDIIINELPNVTINVVEGYFAEICKDSETKLVASGATNYIWYFGENEIGNTSEVTILGENTGTFEYKVVGTDDNGCVNENVISIKVEEPSEGGTVSGPSSVCVTQNEGTLVVADYKGEIQRWESSTDGTNWTPIAETTFEYSFQNLNTDTFFRAVVKNGVCEEAFSAALNVVIDPPPVAGNILFKGIDRVFMMCESPTSDYLIPLNTVGTYVGEIVAWHYRRNSDTDWRTVKNSDGSNYTGTELSGPQVIAASNNESTIFQVEVQSGACSPNVLSETATLSIIPSDIAPNPVTITKEAICIGEAIELSSGTGYGGYGTFQGGAFDNSSIANHGWRVKRFDNDTEYTFQSAADNTRPERWMRTNPHDYLMANPNGDGSNIYQRFDSSSGDSGNKGFAIVSGNNPSTLETPVFNLYATDNPVLTFDQAYNLTQGDTIKVQISLDGGNTYIDEPLFVIGGPALSGNYDKFGDDGLGEPNNMSIDLSKYAGLGNLRIRWLYDGSTGGIYTIDDIGIPQDPENVQLIWYYDADPNDPDNALQQIGEVNQSTVSFTPEKIGWNYFEVQTALVFDTNGDPCHSVENMATIQVYVFDSYTTTAEANVGSCGSTEIALKGTLIGAVQEEVTGFPDGDESTLAWSVITGPDGYEFSESHFTPSVNDPNAVFTPPVEGNYTLSWTITPDEDSTCTPSNGEVSFNFVQCSTLDFDGEDDYVDLGTSYGGFKMIEAWIRPFERPLADGSGNTVSTQGTIISGPGFDINMQQLSTKFSPDGRWYHIAVSSTGELWIDGISQDPISLGNGGNRTIIGARWASNDKETENHFSGWIEEVRIWKNSPTVKELRFMMNQRLKLNSTGTVVSPLEGEIVSNMVIPGSYYTGNGYNLDEDGDPFYNQTSADLLGYYRLISEDPDPDLGVITNEYKPVAGNTPELSLNGNPGRLYNMTTNQENTSPTPYFSANDGAWAVDNTWARPNVWDYPNSKFEGTSIDWNIARTSHNITSDEKNIIMLGLLSDSGLITINADHPIRISHYLLLNGNMDLVGESQLLQDHGSILDDASIGWLERDQQGTQSSFNYNYWSSPVSIQGKSNNSGYTVGEVLGNPIGSITYVNDPFAADATPLNPNNVVISSYWLWTYYPADVNVYANWEEIWETGTVSSGGGFTMKGTSGAARHMLDKQNYAFKGKPHNGDLTLNIGPDQNYLIGNPYPSALDGRQFILDNLKAGVIIDATNDKNVFDGAIYFWDHFVKTNHILKDYEGGYAVLNLTGGVPAISDDWRIQQTDAVSKKAPKRYIPVGQAFLINSADYTSESDKYDGIDGGDINFKNSQRVFKRDNNEGEAIFLKPEIVVKEGKNKNQEEKETLIRLSFKSPIGMYRQILVGAVPNTTNGFDLGYDALLLDNNREDMYWIQGNNYLVIQGVPDFNKEQVLPLGVKIDEEKEFSIQIDTVENSPSDFKIYIRDNLNDTVHNLTKTAYTSTSKIGYIHDRFEIIFQYEKEFPENPGPGEIDYGVVLQVRHSHTGRELQILNPDEIEISNLFLFDLNGNLLEDYDKISNEKEIRLPVRRYSSGVYILKLYAKGKMVTKKIIISN